MSKILKGNFLKIHSHIYSHIPKPLQTYSYTYFFPTELRKKSLQSFLSLLQLFLGFHHLPLGFCIFNYPLSRQYHTPSSTGFLQLNYKHTHASSQFHKIRIHLYTCLTKFWISQLQINCHIYSMSPLLSMVPSLLLLFEKHLMNACMNEWMNIYTGQNFQAKVE